MKVIVLAGGFGTRISEESAIRPKPIITIWFLHAFFDVSFDLLVNMTVYYLMYINRILNLLFNADTGARWGYFYSLFWTDVLMVLFI